MRDHVEEMLMAKNRGRIERAFEEKGICAIWDGITGGFLLHPSCDELREQYHGFGGIETPIVLMAEDDLLSEHAVEIALSRGDALLGG